jgi:hypothetical protein|nr:MAG TPA: hypothetical protein [Caudoviricetes sp.]
MKNLKHNCHRDEKLDGLVGKKVKIEFVYGLVTIGVLSLWIYNGFEAGYRVTLADERTRCFCKTHVKSIEARE